MSAVLVIAEITRDSLAQSTARTVSCAAAIPDAAIDVLVTGKVSGQPAAQAARIAGVRRVIRLEAESDARTLAAAMSAEIARIAEAYTHVFAPASTFGKDLMPRVAALIDAPQVSEITAVHSARRYARLVYAGNAVETVEVAADRIAGTVRLASFDPAPDVPEPAPIELREPVAAVPAHTRLISRSDVSDDRPDLQTAARVVAGGRAFGSAENFRMLYAFADRIGAAVGASRAAVDGGYVSNELQVGQTGKKIAPELYMAFGISGAIQHLAGIRDSGLIVAINKDPDAAIFEVADIGLVADVFEVIPQLLELIE